MLRVYRHKGVPLMFQTHIGVEHVSSFINYSKHLLERFLLPPVYYGFIPQVVKNFESTRSESAVLMQHSGGSL